MIAMIAGAALSCAPRPAGWSDEQKELIRLSDAWIDAEVRHDQEALERILDEGFVASFASSGTTMDRSAFVAWIMQADIEPFEVVNESVEIHGDSARVVATTGDGATRFTWSAVRKSGRWVVVSEAFSPASGKE